MCEACTLTHTPDSASEPEIPSPPPPGGTAVDGILWVARRDGGLWVGGGGEDPGGQSGVA